MIKRVFLLSILFEFFFVSSAAANSTLLIDEDFNIISVNGKSFNNGFLSDDSKIQLIPGVNKVAIEYEVVFDQDDEFDLVKSDTLLLSFYATDSRKFVLQYIKPANVKSARLFAKNPKLSIVDSQGKLIRTSSYFLGSKSESFVNQQTKPSLSGQPPLRITSSKKSTSQKEGKSSSVDPSERLEYWWQKATPKQRQSFLNKIAKEQ